MRTIKLIKGLVVISLFSFLAACGSDESVTLPGSISDESVSMPDSIADGDLVAPRVVSQFPAEDGNASIDVVVSMTFDEEIDQASITADSVQLSGPTGTVNGEVLYDSSLKQLSFISENYLVAFSSYEVVLASVTDIYGNSIEPVEGWNFTTIFDQLPPELPEF